MMIWGPQDPGMYRDQVVRAVTASDLFALNAVLIP